VLIRKIAGYLKLALRGAAVWLKQLLYARRDGGRVSKRGLVVKDIPID